MLLAIVVQTPPPTFDPIFTPHTQMSGPVFVIVALAVVTGFVLVFYPLMRAFARRIEGRHRLDPGLQEDLEQMRSRVADMDNLHHRVAELEERVDFTERMLAQRPVSERLPEGRS